MIALRFHQASVSSNNQLSFQCSYASLRAETFQAHSLLLASCATMKSCPPPAIATAVAMATGQDVQRLSHFAAQVSLLGKRDFLSGGSFFTLLVWINVKAVRQLVFVLGFFPFNSLKILMCSQNIRFKVALTKQYFFFLFRWLNAAKFSVILVRVMDSYTALHLMQTLWASRTSRRILSHDFSLLNLITIT